MIVKMKIIIIIIIIIIIKNVMEINSPTENPFVQLAFEGCQRLCETQATKKESITSDMIMALVSNYGGKIIVFRI